MQVLKDELRQNIRDAAVETFKEKGYRAASMREIATKADMSVGNLYRYYKNKEELFGYIVQPLVKMFEAAQKEQKKDFDFEYLDVNFLEHNKIIEAMVESRALYQDELFLLFLRADGSDYEGARNAFTTFIEAQMKKFVEDISEGEPIIKGTMFYRYSASMISDAFCTILENSESKEDFVYNLIEMGEYIFKPALRNLLAIKNDEISFRRISDEEISRRFSDHRFNSSDSSATCDGDGK